MPRSRTPVYLLLVALMTLQVPSVSAQTFDVWLGTTTPRGGSSKGIYYTRLDAETGKLASVELAAEIGSPGFLAMHPTAPVLYAVGNQEGEGIVASFAIQSDAGRSSLQRLSTTRIPDGGAAHVAVDRSGKVLVTAQYGAGSVALFALDDDHSVKRHLKSLKHQGGSRVVPERQDAPHAHWAGTDPANRFVFVPDLGLDQVLIYRLELGASPDLLPHGHGDVPAGAGPRHMKFHPSGRFIYVLNELALTVTTFAYDAEAGAMKALQTIATVPEVEKAKERFISASEIRVHPSGKFVYAANRGHDTVTAFRVDESSGLLSLIEREPIRGSYPRNFNIDPTGRWLLAAGRDSNTLAVFEIDQETGELVYTRTIIPAPSPICVEFGKRW